ncbi:hypothetical protein NP493_4159g00001 [Ridgeia piscesae]|uniref:Uncharacterized protein n=1 Tax=Ridgeia piscesae TaxID=27915 RepID=A0AAD9J1Z5_RIDPI|nr:hypothetical protein NP493_4159g00001 [Ridgeia piscesae]
MAGFMLSGSGIRVFVLGNMGLGWGGWGKVQIKGGGVVGMGCGGGRGGGVYCLLEVPEGGRGAIVRLMSCNAPLKVSRLLWANTLEESLLHWAIVREKSCICSSCGRLDLVWLCPGMKYWLGLMSKRLFGLSPPLF